MSAIPVLKANKHIHSVQVTSNNCEVSKQQTMCS